MSRLRSPDFDYGGHGDAPHELSLTTWFWAAHLMATHSNGMSARQFEDQLGLSDKTAWLLTQMLRRSMVDPNREPLEGVVEVDQTEIPFRADDSFFEPGGEACACPVGRSQSCLVCEEPITRFKRKSRLPNRRDPSAAVTGFPPKTTRR